MVPSITVIINTLNRGRLLGKALAGVMQQRHARFEIVVVDGPSIDETQAVLARFDQVKVGRCPEPNLSMSRNIGLAMARGDIVAFLDDDAVPEPTWLERLAEAYDAPDVGAVGGFIRDRTGIGYQARITVCDRFGDAQDFASLAHARAALVEGERYLSPTGANASYRRAALLEIDGFDETFTYFLDETDVNLRLYEAGWRLRFAEGAQVHHKLAGNARRDDRNVPLSLYEPCRSKAYFAIRHGRGEGWPGDVVSRLADHGVSLLGHNRALLEGGLIDVERRARLDADVERGLCEGVALAIQSTPPPRLQNRTLAAHAGERFRQVEASPGRQRLRIAFASRQYPPGAVGGIGVWTENAARALADRGHEVSVITAAAEASPSIDFEHGVWVHRIAAAPTPGRLVPPLPDLPESIRRYAYAVHDALCGVIAQRGLDVFSWPIWDLEGLAVQSAGLTLDVVSLHTTCALAAPFKPEWGSDLAYRRSHVDKVIAAETAVLEAAPFVLANSRQVLEDIRHVSAIALAGPRVSMVPHGLRDRSAGVRPKRGDGRVRLLFVGRLELRKGIDLFLDAAAAILAEDDRVDVQVIGEALPLESGLTASEAFARRFGSEPWFDRVVFEGAVSAERLDQAYADCDIFVAPSRYESFGLVFVEAMMFAKPCVGLNVGGVGEVVVDGRTGRLAHSDDADSLKAAMVDLIGDADLRRRMGAAARARYLAEFTAEQMAARLEALYRDVIAARGQASPRRLAFAGDDPPA